MARERRSGGSTPTPAARAATLLPVALGLAAHLTTSAPHRMVGSAIASPAVAQALDAESLATSQLIAIDHRIPQVDLAAPASEILESWEKPTPNKSHLGTCGWYGSEGADEITNQRKNRTDLPPSYHAVDFGAITDLDWPKDATTRRDHWTSAQLAVIAPYEGEAVTVTGFIAALRPQAHNSEATNCEEHGEPLTDWHIALVGNPGDAESQAVVVEATPRIKQKHPNWTPSRLQPWVKSADSVRVSGYLLLDPVHKGHLGIFRRTLWEVHPIHRIELWHAGQWKDLDDMP